MAKIKITTVQNLDLEFQLANIGERILAWLLDAVIQFAIVMLLLILLLALGVQPGAGVMFTLGAIAFLYHLVSEIVSNGQSIGKRAVGIRVVRLDGSRPTVGNYIMRWIFRLLETNPGVFYGVIALVALIMSRKGQRIGDLLSGTTVIRTNRKAFLHETIFRKNNPDYKALYPQSATLSDRDANITQEVINLYLRTSNVEVLNFCANRVCHVLNVHPAGLNALQFLQQVLRDHNAMH